MQISNTGVTSNPKDVERLREEFCAVNCVRIPQLLHPSLLAFLQRRLEQAQWKSNLHGVVGNDLGMDDITEDQASLHMLYFAANLPDFRGLIEEITECRPLDSFRGRLYRKISGAGHYNKWHSDDVENRLVAMSINLSPRGYGGGWLEMRKAESEEILLRVGNTGYGDALIFKISSELEHRVTDVQGKEPKTAFAGWFRDDRRAFFHEVLNHSRRAMIQECVQPKT
jgi:2OG-Fe(II) oxygenase superfamily